MAVEISCGLTDSAKSRPSPIIPGATLPIAGTGGTAFVQAMRDHPSAGYEALKHPALGRRTRIKLRLHALTAALATGARAIGGFESTAGGEYDADDPEQPKSAVPKSRLPKPKPHLIASLSTRGIFIGL